MFKTIIAIIALFAASVANAGDINYSAAMRGPTCQAAAYNVSVSYEHVKAKRLVLVKPVKSDVGGMAIYNAMMKGLKEKNYDLAARETFVSCIEAFEELDRKAEQAEILAQFKK